MKYSEYYKQRNPENKTNTKFIKWIDQVEKSIIEKLGVGLLDLPDQLYMMSWEAGHTSNQMVEQILEDGF